MQNKHPLYLFLLLLITIVPLLLTLAIKPSERGPFHSTQIAGRVWLYQGDRPIKHNFAVYSAKEVIGEDYVVPAQQYVMTMYYISENRLASHSTVTDMEGKFKFTIADLYRPYLITVQEDNKILYSDFSHYPQDFRQNEIILAPPQLTQGVEKKDLSKIYLMLDSPPDFLTPLSKTYSTIVLFIIGLAWLIIAADTIIKSIRRRKRISVSENKKEEGDFTH